MDEKYNLIVRFSLVDPHFFICAFDNKNLDYKKLLNSNLKKFIECAHNHDDASYFTEDMLQDSKEYKNLLYFDFLDTLYEYEPKIEISKYEIAYYISI